MRYQQSTQDLSGASNSISTGALAQKAQLRIVVEEAGSLSGIKSGHVFELGNDTTIIGRDSFRYLSERPECFSPPSDSKPHFWNSILENLSESVTPILEVNLFNPVINEPSIVAVIPGFSLRMFF